MFKCGYYTASETSHMFQHMRFRLNTPPTPSLLDIVLNVLGLNKHAQVPSHFHLQGREVCPAGGKNPKLHS